MRRAAISASSKAPGSGGYGPPSERDPARIADDLADGYVGEVAGMRD